MNLIYNTLLCPITNLSKLTRAIDSDLNLKPGELTRPPEGQLQLWHTGNSRTSDWKTLIKTTERHGKISLKSGELTQPPEKDLPDWNIQKVYQISNSSRPNRFREQFNEVATKASELIRPPEDHSQNWFTEDLLNSVWWEPCETMETYGIITLKPSQLTRPPEERLQNWHTKDFLTSEWSPLSKTTNQHRKIDLKSGEFTGPSKKYLNNCSFFRVNKISSWFEPYGFRDQLNKGNIKATELTRPPEKKLQNWFTEGSLDSVWWEACKTMEEYSIVTLKPNQLTRPPERYWSSWNTDVLMKDYLTSNWTEPSSDMELYSKVPLTTNKSKSYVKNVYTFGSNSCIIMSQQNKMYLDSGDLIEPSERNLSDFFHKFMEYTSPGSKIVTAGRKFEEKKNRTDTEEKCSVNETPEDFFQKIQTSNVTEDTRSTVTLVNLNVNEFRPEEITVKLTRDGVLIVEGTHRGIKNAHGLISRSFVRRYAVPVNCDSSKIESNLSLDGVLIISAPMVVPIDMEYMGLPIAKTGKPADQLNFDPERVDDILYS